MSATNKPDRSDTVRLYLLRHGPAGLRSAWNADDADRPLTGSGRRRIKEIARALAFDRLELDLILTSPYIRADQTAQIVAKRLDRRDVTFVDERLAPGFAIDELRAILDDHADAETIMLVGHEPDFSALTAVLCGARIALQKGAMIELELDRQHPKDAVLLRVEQPRHLLRSIAPRS